MPVTDQAIAKIKDLIVSGEFGPGAKLPREQDLAARLGLSRNSLREAVRALTLVGVLDTRVGDGTYVTSLDADSLLMGLGFVGDLLEGDTLLEAHQVRRILEPVATALATPKLTSADFAALEERLARMANASSTQEFIDADTEFHRIIVSAAGNPTLASLIQSMSGGVTRARLWRTVTDRDTTLTVQRHRDIYTALRAGDAEQAAAADLLHLAEFEAWVQQWLAEHGGPLTRQHANESPLSGAGNRGNGRA
ncbi:MAG: FadR/GntR family transcriptional regulator [Solirubrobacteraceae bacterium]